LPASLINCGPAASIREVRVSDMLELGALPPPRVNVISELMAGRAPPGMYHSGYTPGYTPPCSTLGTPVLHPSYRPYVRGPPGDVSEQALPAGEKTVG